MSRKSTLIQPIMKLICRDRLSVLIFHRVLPALDGLLGGDPTADEFARTMRWVKETFNVIPLSEGVRGIKDGRLPERALSITFDDGYADNAMIAAPILSRLGLHATFFIATGYLDGGRMFNDTVIEAIRTFKGAAIDLDELGLGIHATTSVGDRRSAVEELLQKIKYLPEAERTSVAERIAEIARASPPTDLMMTSEQASELARSGFELGGHTVNHPILAQLSPHAAKSEILRGRDRLQELSGSRIGLFAYPNGRPQQDYGAATLKIVRDLEFDGAVSTSRGAGRIGSDPYQIPRFTPWDVRPLRFTVQMASNLIGTEPAYVSA